MYKRIFDLQNNGINMTISGNYIYIINGKYILKYDLTTFTEKVNIQLFKKEGKARSLFICNDYIYIRDFCDLYEINCKTLEVKRTWKLGENLSSDICSETGDKNNVYACIRGGKITRIDLKSGNLKQYNLSDSSMWDIIIHDRNIYLACTNGELLVLDKNKMSVIQRKQIHKKNIYSLLMQKNVLYTISQDTSLTATNIATFEIVQSVKKVISNMSRILGIYGKNLITSNPNRNEITLWDTKSLSQNQNINFPTGGLGNNKILMKGSIIYGSNNDGIYKLDLTEI